MSRDYLFVQGDKPAKSQLWRPETPCTLGGKSGKGEISVSRRWISRIAFGGTTPVGKSHRKALCAGSEQHREPTWPDFAANHRWGQTSSNYARLPCDDNSNTSMERRAKHKGKRLVASID